MQSIHLIGLKQIAASFKVGVATVRRWRRQGAPILIIGRKYQANYSELWQWLRSRA